MNKRKKLWAIVGGIILVVGVGLGVWFYQSQQIKTQMTDQEFSQLKDLKMEIVDTHTFLDKKLETWYKDNRKEEGIYLRSSGDSTYVLASLGKVNDKNTFLLLNGVKEVKGKLVISYEKLEMKDVQNVKFEDNIRATLIKVKGNYDQAITVSVEETAKTDVKEPVSKEDKKPAKDDSKDSKESVKDTKESTPKEK